MTQPPSAAVSSKTRPPSVYSALRAMWPWLAALASGVSLVMCLEPWNQQWLCWLALTPLLTAVWFGEPERRSVLVPPVGKAVASLPDWRRRWQRLSRGPRVVLRGPGARGFALGYVAGLVFFWGAFYWLWEVTPPGWFILAFYMGLYPAVWGAFMATVGRPDPALRPSGPATAVERLRLSDTKDFASASPFLRSRWNLWFAFLAAASWTALEWVRGWMFSGFGWNDLGIGLHAILPLIQIAEWTGVGGVSFLAAFTNVIAVATVYRFFLEVRVHRVRPHFDFTLTIAGLLGVFTFGLHRVQAIDRESVRPGVSVPLRVAAVQANTRRVERLTPELATKIFKNYEKLTGAALANRPQLLLWPESSMVLSMFADQTTHDFVVHTANQAPDTNLLLGTVDFDFGPENKAEADYNAAALLPAGGGEIQTYRKMHLVPFGEYIPFRKSFPLFASKIRCRGISPRARSRASSVCNPPRSAQRR